MRQSRSGSIAFVFNELFLSISLRTRFSDGSLPIAFLDSSIHLAECPMVTLRGSLSPLVLVSEIEIVLLSHSSEDYSRAARAKECNSD